MRPTRTRARDGFALAELLVATTLLVVGLLAIAGTTSQLARAESAARRTARAAELLAERVERVAGAECADSSGARSADGLDERWQTWSDDGVPRLVDSVRYTIAAVGARAAALDVVVRCQP